MEDQIANFMMKESKFEFFLVNRDLALAHTAEVRGLTVVTGVNWTKLSQSVEAKFPFETFDFAQSGFRIFVSASPIAYGFGLDVFRNRQGMSSSIWLCGWPLMMASRVSAR